MNNTQKSSNNGTQEFRRHVRAAPMSEQQYEAFHETQRELWSIETKANEAAKRGVELRVVSLPPYDGVVSYSEFVKQVEERRRAREAYAGELALTMAQETA